MTQLNPYLSFGGNAEEAFNFYKSVFGGDFAAVMRWGDNPQACDQFPDLDKNSIMHIALAVGDSMIMASDDAMGNLKEGNNFSVAINPDSREDSDRIFAGLSAGGNVTCPMMDMFWGGYFGSFTDKFGINWLINYSEQNA
jgi:PhnB protein